MASSAWDLQISGINPAVLEVGSGFFYSLAAFALAVEAFSRYGYFAAALDEGSAGQRVPGMKQARAVLAAVATFMIIGLLHSVVLFFQFNGADRTKDTKLSDFTVPMPGFLGGQRLTQTDFYNLTHQIAVTFLHGTLVHLYHARKAFLASAGQPKPASAFPDVLSLVSLALIGLRLAYLLFPLPLPPIRPPLDPLRVVTTLPVLISGMTLVGRILGDGSDKTGKKLAAGIFLACLFTVPTLLLPRRNWIEKDSGMNMQDVFYDLAAHAMYIWLLWEMIMGVFGRAGELRDSDTADAKEKVLSSRGERRAKEKEVEKEDKKKKRKGE